MAGFAICVAGGVACFMIAFFVGLPLLMLLQPSKFATSFTLGSILLMTRYFHAHARIRTDQTGNYVLQETPLGKQIADMARTKVG